MDIFDSPKDCIRTNSGIFMNVFETTDEMINIEDIAHALASLPRFGGHTDKQYSVAQHSVMCYTFAKTLEDKKAALMHDASEAYLLDIPTPIKAKLPDYKGVEEKLMVAIAAKYGFEFPLSDNVHKIDREMLLLEWKLLVVDKGVATECWSQEYAKQMFLEAFNSLF
jgi:hypothetical protein